MIHLDTRFFLEALEPDSPAARQLETWLENGEELNLSAIAWFELLAGTFTDAERRQASRLFPRPEPFLAEDAEKAAELFQLVGRRRALWASCQVAAVAIRAGALLATENPGDFEPWVLLGLKLMR
jgi:predicted nucleic acid-binding protein